MSLATKAATTAAAEPVVTTASITAGVTAAIALLVAFGVPVNDEQKVAIIGVVAVVAPLVVTVARRYVTPVRGGEHRVEG